MNKEKARELINEYLKKYGLPIDDVTIYSTQNNTTNTHADWTFKGLLCIVYDDLELKK
tara:strand:- start:411 stop:584 length:174 start_codon:yes stop_codon:yes gene_type:complete